MFGYVITSFYCDSRHCDGAILTCLESTARTVLISPGVEIFAEGNVNSTRTADLENVLVPQNSSRRSNL